MIWFCYLCKKLCFPLLGVAHGDPILSQVGLKNGNFQDFQRFFFRTTAFQLKLLKLIESPNIFDWKPAKKIKVGLVLEQNLFQICPNVVKKVKKQVLSIVFFFFEWKFKANIARNATFEGCLGPNFCLIWSKMAKN